MSSRPTILVVDDDGPILILMRNLLREFGFDAVTVPTGVQAIEEARKRAPDLVLLDKNMPGMSGADVIKVFRNDLALGSVPILILSGEPVEPDELSALGATGAVLKPFDVMALIGEIKGHLASTTA